MNVIAKGVICAFPGTGKSTIHSKGMDLGLYPVRDDGTALYRSILGYRTKVYDSDSSKFDKAEFPDNYIQHMMKCLWREVVSPNGFLFLASSHENVREMMTKRKIPYVLVYPDRSLKNEYIERYKQRNSPKAFIDLMDKKWDEFIDSCEKDENTKIVLKSGQYLIDVLKVSK